MKFIVQMILAAVLACWTSQALAVEALKFETDVRPILKASCFHCHGEDGVQKGELDVRLVRLMTGGGKSGAALKPGDVEASLLWEKIASDEMPKGEKKLSAEDKQLIREWIEQGAQTARPEPENVEEARFTLEELEHWAFQPVTNPEVPDGDDRQGSIDRFIGAGLQAKGLGFSPSADRRTLIRRITFDLTGLPPTPEEVAAFVSDSKNEAYAHLLDRLLASPQFGVRWARHWLDAAGFSESDGLGLSDPKREHAWRYRDYVIDAFNQNKPIDQFIHEQLAGDEMIEGERDINNPRHLELLTATGFLRMAPDPTQKSNTLTDRNTAVASAIQVVSSSLLGVTVACAQCHDHKYDPIGIDDYYRFRAIFDPAFPLNNWQQPSNRLVDMTTVEVNAERARIEAEAKAVEDEIEGRRRAHCAEIQKKKLADVPEEVRKATREAVLKKAGERDEKQKQLLDLYPMVKPVDFIIGLLVEYDGAAFRKFEEEKKKVAQIRAKKPPLRMVMATTEPAGEIPVSKVFFRGNPESPREAVEPAELMVLRRHRPEFAMPVNDPGRRTTRRRLAYARSLTDGTHPLTARVFVNRIWMHHFGRGLVATPGDFGIAGEKPSHPELLDWLANDFVEHGWDQKRLHRMIMLSKTYQQQSLRRPDLDQIDPENTLFGRANLRRLEAEAIRDALLHVSGQLDATLGGPASPVSADSEGKAVIGGNKNRRSAFVEVQRRLPSNMLATFDQPEMVPNCDQRRNTTVAIQALWFLNDQEVIGFSETLARSLMAEPGGDEQRLSRLYLRLFSKPATPEELQTCKKFLVAQRDHFAQQDPKADAAHRALAALSQVLLASNRFLYLD